MFLKYREGIFYDILYEIWKNDFIPSFCFQKSFLFPCTLDKSLQFDVSVLGGNR